MNRRPPPLVGVLALIALASQDATALGPDVPTGGEPRYLLLRRDPEVTVPAMAHELARQAVLNAARDDLGLLARDQALGETVPDEEAAIVLSLTAGLVTGAGGDRYEIRLQRRDGPAEVLRFPTKPVELEDLALRLDGIGRLARDELPAALRRLAKFPGKADAVRDAGPVPPGVEAALAEFSPFAQYGALRSLHATIRDDGESPERLAALVRAYANLGSQTEFLWTPISDVFQARSLLYAQRLLTRDPESPRGYWHRAYAWALAGAHGLALTDLDEADRRAKSAPAPAWVALIRAACRFDAKALAAAEPGPEFAPLADWLRFLAAEDTGITARIEAIGAAVLEANPEAFRVADGLADKGRIHVRHEWTVAPLAGLSRALPRRLAPLPGLPGSVARRLAPRLDEVAATRALADEGPADDSPAPTWAALARIIRELRFAQVESRLAFMRITWSVPVDEFLAAARPVVADHPYRDFLEAYAFRGVDPGRHAEALGKVAVDRESADVDAQPIFNALSDLDGGERWVWPVRRADRVHRDLVRVGAIAGGAASKATYARQLLEASPHSPVARVQLIRYDWEAVRDRADAWEREFADWPSVQFALGTRYHDLGRLDDARRCYEAAIRLAKVTGAYHNLAEIHRTQGRMDRWRATLDAYLADDEPGLNAAQVRVAMARQFLADGQTAEARRYAETAAETGAEWAMRAAADCARAAGDWAAAEDWIKQIAERYGKVLEWYYWCRETGHGGVKAARRAVDAWIRAEAAAGRAVIPWVVGPLQILDDEPRRAVQTLRASFAEGGRLGEGSLLALLADELGDRRLRDATWEALAARAEEPAEIGQLGRFAGLVRAALARGEDGPLDTAAVDELIRTGDGPVPADVAYYAGRFLELHGRKEEARRYLDDAVRSPRAREPIRILAAVRLRALGGDPEAPARATPKAGRTP